MSCKSRIVKWQKTREVVTKRKFSGEASPYTDWAKFHTKTEEGEFKEFPEANPDVLPEPELPEENRNRKLILENWHEIKFTPKEKEILSLLAKGYSQTRVAKQLNVTQSRVGHAITRIQKKAARWYGHKRANGGNIVQSTCEEND